MNFIKVLSIKLVLFCIVMFISGCSHKKAKDVTLEKYRSYNVLWDSPGMNELGSVPIGNGQIGANVWIQKNGELVLLLSHTDSWDEAGRLLKLGMVRVQAFPEEVSLNTPFKQELDIVNGQLLVRLGNDEKFTSLKVWIDANNPVIHIETQGSDASECEVNLDLWRKENRQGSGADLIPFSDMGTFKYFNPKLFADEIVPESSEMDDLIWFHRNAESIYPVTLKGQELGGYLEKNKDPLLNRTFGALISGENMKREKNKLKSVTAQKKHHVSITCLTKVTHTKEEWINDIKSLDKEIQAKDLSDAYEEHCGWWHSFWKRSSIFISGNKEAEAVTAGYIHQRYQLAASGRGTMPVKFNGGIFTVGQSEGSFDPDYRRWGGAYWFQNNRHLYWPMLASGDQDLIMPFFDMYKNALELAKYRTQTYYGHEGAFFPETQYFWGTYSNTCFYYQQEKPAEGELPKSASFPNPNNPYMKNYWDNGIELSAMMLDYFDYTQDSCFAKEYLVPVASEIMTFFDQHWERKDGKIQYYPTHAVETYWGARNPSTIIGGLRYVLPRLVNLSETLTTKKMREQWGRTLTELIELPFDTIDGVRRIAPAQEYGKASNQENPSLYPVFPYALYGVGQPELELARNTYLTRRIKSNKCWYQDAIHAANVGFAEDAQEDVVAHFTNGNESMRYPYFWKAENDWVPDYDNGGSASTALQQMLIKSVGEKIIITPAWPKDWNVEFKLHAPKNTTVTGVIRNGAVIELDVEPESRKKDIVLWNEN
ncbi:DUF5703 domain-containing protein [Sunxiuqinia elliptica]|uniref:DUF5703 domain-containing protein n=1 Tax=Sunxiuqinia elliptica TaxID=655355 RepID=A0A1I2GUI2_9BACT|nr:DUF5703 domain-containing protein [Sunxiuqinia elliptica]SFF20719.1 hypothetical protein SAMN05216283_103116 [Sunxiuqinia elliptica]